MKLRLQFLVVVFAALVGALPIVSTCAEADDPLHSITIAREFDQVPCNGEMNFQYDSMRWIDEDNDGENTRQEVLAAESWVSVVRDANGKVVGGLWVGPYAGHVTRNPRELDIDHVVALCEAWRSGAHDWTQARRVQYANYLAEDRHLIATWLSTNRSKKDRDPAHWLPPNRAYWCTYLDDWTAIKRKWGLTMDSKEATAVRRGLRVCERYAKSDCIDGHH